MNIVDEQLLDVWGKLISCIVTTLIVFDFFDTQYNRKYQMKSIYIFIRIMCIGGNLGVFQFNNPSINVVYWILMMLFISSALYRDDKNKLGQSFGINTAFIFCCAICESIGCLMVQAEVNMLKISKNENLVYFVYTVGGSVSVALLYYLVLRRLFAVEKTKKRSATQYIIYVIITIYVLVNIGSILFILQYDLYRSECIFLLSDAVLVIILSLYLFYLLDIFAENKDLKYKVLLYEQQAKVNYAYYAKQIESNQKALSVIHDIRKHTHVIEELRQSQIVTQLQEYTNSFEEMIKPLIIKQFTDNTVLNIIINGKIDYCEKNNICFNVEIVPVHIDFMEPIDITTLMGNLLDNAIAACEKSEEKRIYLKMYPFNDFIYILLENTHQEKLKWNQRGRPISQKGEEHGIGLENVENVIMKYNGNIQFSEKDGIFSVDIMLSQI